LRGELALNGKIVDHYRLKSTGGFAYSTVADLAHYEAAAPTFCASESGGLCWGTSIVTSSWHPGSPGANDERGRHADHLCAGRL